MDDEDKKLHIKEIVGEDMLKIAMITPGYLPVPAVKGGAVEVLIEELIKGNEEQKNCVIDCYTVDDENIRANKYRNTNIKIVKIKKTTQIINKLVNCSYKLFKRKKWRTSFSREMVKMLKKEKYDYIVVHNNLMAYRDIYEKTVHKDNLVYVLHNNIGDDINHIIMAKLVGRTAKKVLAVSKYTRDDFTKITGSNNVDVLYNCIDFTRYSQSIVAEERKSLRERYNIKESDFVFIYSGRIDIYKGVLELVKAFEKLDNNNAKLLIVGKSWFGDDGNKDEYTEKIIEEAEEIKDKIVFSGFIEPENMPLMYQISDCLVVPSIWEEPFGVVALEGMASSLPLIVTNSGGLMEIVDDKCAFVVNKEHDIVNNLMVKMDEMMINREKSKEMGEYGRKCVIENPEYDSRKYFSYFCQKIDAL